jgi:RNA polymerase sigma-70 factor (ECF subfamily)
MTAPSQRASANVLHLSRVPSLAARLHGGVPGAAAELFDRHAAAVERAVQGVLGFDAEVDDVVQDAFVAALRGIAGFRGDSSSLGAWVRGIAVRLALKKLRWRRTWRWLGRRGSDELHSLIAPTDTETQAALVRVYAVLERLPSLERAAFGLRFVEGLQLTEVAEALGISLATTKRRLLDARARFERIAASDSLLREWIEPEGRT